MSKNKKKRLASNNKKTIADSNIIVGNNTVEYDIFAKNQVLYTDSSFASTLVDKKVDDSTRNGITFTSSGSTKLNKDFKKTKILHLVNTALKEARVFGGAGIVIIEEDKDLSSPLDIDKITTDSKVHYQVFSSNQLIPYAVGLLYDITSEDLLNIEYYSIQVSGAQQNNQTVQKIHSSRVLKFHGKPLMSFDKIANANSNTITSSYYHGGFLGAWGRSIFNSVLISQIEEFDKVYTKIIKMIGKGSVDFYSMKDIDQSSMTDVASLNKLTNSIKANQEQAGISVITGDSDYKRIQGNFSGYQEILDNLAQYLSINEGYPLTYFLGSPTPGSFLNGGSADMQAYYAVVSDMQNNQIRNPLIQLIYIWQMQTYGKRDENLDFDFNPLFEPNPKEQQELETGKINNLMNLYNSGLISAETVVSSLEADTNIPIQASDKQNAKDLDYINDDSDQDGGN